MSGQYSPMQFFRHTPKAALGRYFQQKHGVLQGVDFEKLGETDVQPIFDAVTALPSETQAEIEAECQEIDAMSCPGGIKALCDEAEFHQDKTFAAAVSQMDRLHGAALWAFLEHPRYWNGAALFLQADRVSESLWKKRNDLPHRPARVDDDTIKQFAEAIGAYFHKKEGRGRNCKVEVLRRHEKEYFFAYPEDYARAGMEWVRNSLAARSRRPAFEIYIVYSQADGSLDIHARGNTSAVPALQEIFAEQILGFGELDEFAAEKGVYALDGLANRNFVFKYPPGVGIESVAVRLLRLSLVTGKKRRVTVEADPKHDAKALYELMDRISVPPHHVTQAVIGVTFAAKAGRRARIRTFKISYPNWCALRHDGEDLVIRRMLADSGIDLMQPRADETQAVA